MARNYYEVTFDTKKGGYMSWVRYIGASSATAAKQAVKDLWDDCAPSSISGAHMFHVSARRLESGEIIRVLDFAVRDRRVMFYMSGDRRVYMSTPDHGAPYTHELVRDNVRRWEGVETEVGVLGAPGVAKKYSLWCVRDREGTIVAHDWAIA